MKIDLKIFCFKRTLEGSKKKLYPFMTVASLGEQKEAKRSNVVWIKQEFDSVIESDTLHMPTDGWTFPGRTLWLVLYMDLE